LTTTPRTVPACSRARAPGRRGSGSVRDLGSDSHGQPAERHRPAARHATSRSRNGAGYSSSLTGGGGGRPGSAGQGGAGGNGGVAAAGAGCDVFCSNGDIGASGALGQGGAGAFPSGYGGGGGGGLYGGGGGGSGAQDEFFSSSAGGGGGGGSSRVPAGGSVASNTTGLPPEVTISYTVGVPASCAGRAATIVGSARADRLGSTHGSDVIVGGPGSDRIRGGGGNDLICAGPGNDRVAGGRGDDRLAGGPGRDRLAGGPGRDRVAGGGGTIAWPAAREPTASAAAPAPMRRPTSAPPRATARTAASPSAGQDAAASRLGPRSRGRLRRPTNAAGGWRRSQREVGCAFLGAARQRLGLGLESRGPLCAFPRGLAGARELAVGSPEVSLCAASPDAEHPHSSNSVRPRQRSGVRQPMPRRSAGSIPSKAAEPIVEATAIREPLGCGAD
jgi:RTX calcium-binding nonapeptide repeat (4 copies)